MKEGWRRPRGVSTTLLCCNGTRAGWDWSLIARGVVSRTRVGYIEIATNDRVRSCPGETSKESSSLAQREEDPLLLTEGGIKGERCPKPPSIYRAFQGVAWERIRTEGTSENRTLFHRTGREECAATSAVVSLITSRSIPGITVMRYARALYLCIDVRQTVNN